MPVKALLISFASVCIARTAAKAIRARIKAYSTRPCPASSLCTRARDFRIIFFILLSPQILRAPSQGGSEGTAFQAYYWHVGGQKRIEAAFFMLLLSY